MDVCVLRSDSIDFAEFESVVAISRCIEIIKDDVLLAYKTMVRHNYLALSTSHCLPLLSLYCAFCAYSFSLLSLLSLPVLVVMMKSKELNT